jgi:hypothetical protein
MNGIMGGPANYHRWDWDGWSSEETGDFGAPAGHYQFQLLAFAFGIMQRKEQTMSMRYSHIVKLRADLWAQGTLPSAEHFPSVFNSDKAYVFGESRKTARGVIPQYPNDFLVIFGRHHATAAVSLLQLGGLLLQPHDLMKSSCRGGSSESFQATNAVWPECYLIFALESAYGAHNVNPFPPIIGDAWSWIKPGDDDVLRLKLLHQQLHT